MQTLPPISYCKSLKLACQNYAKCSGRSRRSEFYYFYVTVNAIISILYISLMLIIFEFWDYVNEYITYSIYGIDVFIFLVTLSPILSLLVRRFHDAGISTGLILIYLIPSLCMFVNLFASFLKLLAEIYILYICSTDSQQMTNDYGPSPKYLWSSGNLIQGNNYIPPNGPINQFPQPNYMPIPVNSNYPNQQPNPIQNQGNFYQQPNPIPNQGNFYQQPNPIPNQGNLYQQPNPIPNQGNPYPQQNPIQYQESPNLLQNPLISEDMNKQQSNNIPIQNNITQTNPMQQPLEGTSFQPLDDPYAKPNPMQP